MKLVWKNESGCVLKELRFNDKQITPKEALERTDWLLDVGDVVEFQKDVVEFDDVFDTLNHYVEQVFRDIHDGYDINNGDITPEEEISLRTKTIALAEWIQMILIRQKERDDNGEENRV